MLMTTSKWVEAWAQLYLHTGEGKKNICRNWKEKQTIKEKVKKYCLDM